jgi:hypothetical protein
LSHLKTNVAEAFHGYVVESGCNVESISLHFAARLAALGQFKDDFVEPSINITWNFLIWHQLVYEAVAIEHPHLFGFELAASQSIREAVNKDMQRIFAAALKSEVTPSKCQDYKVITIALYILNPLEEYALRHAFLYPTRLDFCQSRS